jgi:putative tryptophan/tyrosine transport system substrate-binding protein
MSATRKLAAILAADVAGSEARSRRSNVRRRDVIAGLLVAATVGRAQAQQSGRVYRIANVYSSTPVAETSISTILKSPAGRAYFEELRRLGFVVEQNLVVERYSGEGRIESFADLARDVVRSNPDLIVADSTRLVLALKAATTTIPIFGFTSDPVANGIVPSLARPGGNITGMSTEAGLEISGKRLELLRKAIPGVTRVGFLASRGVWELAEGATVRQAAQKLGMSIVGSPLDSPIQETEYRRVFAAMVQARAEALIVLAQQENLTNAPLIVALAKKDRLPAIFPHREAADLGGLIAYAPDIVELSRYAANEVGQILRGTNPGDIPYYQLTKFELIINLKTAKTLGIEMPSSLLAQADEVIE